MRKVLIALPLLALALGAAAQDNKSPAADLGDEIDAIIAQNSGAQLGTMTIADVEKIAGQISIAVQKAEYIRHARMASFMLPGLGQFKTGDALGGSLFLAGDLTVLAGTLVGAYFLLPANVQFNSLDYFNTPLSAIKATWTSNTLLQYLPSAAVLAGGMIVDMLFRWFSSSNAAEKARENIADGKVVFQPTLFPLIETGRGGRIGMGLMMRLRM